jgi:peptidoglycan/LPS O-acetylase OafA/YrhL
LIACVSYRFVEQPGIATGRTLEKNWLARAVSLGRNER